MILGLIFTKGESLESWIKQGIFEREKIIYEEYIKNLYFNEIYWFTYGSTESQYISFLPAGIKIISMPKIFAFKYGAFFYSILMPFIKKKEIKNINILKTNQMKGSWTALMIKILYNKPLLLRTGFTRSLFINKKIHKFIYKIIERMSYSLADLGMVSSQADKEYIIKNYNIKPQKITVIPTYVHNDFKFKIKLKDRNEKRILFVGRLNKQKNIFNIISAAQKLNLAIDLYGQGPEESVLKDFVNSLKADVDFKGLVSNKKLPEVYNNYKYYILASEYEGMPKTLIEAMACGCVCIGTDVTGIRELIIDSKTGFLSDSVSSDDIKTTLKRALDYKSSSIIAENAVEFIRKNYSLENFKIKEKILFERLKDKLTLN